MGKEFDMVNKLGRRHNLEPKRVPWGEFSWQPLLMGLVFYVFFNILFTLRTLQNLHVEALCS